MRYSPDHKAQTHQRIIKEASARFRKDGIGGTGLQPLMKALGLTHGGFYSHFKSKEELRKLYAGVGIDGSKPVITYCRIGERSSHTWFALSKILGYDVKNYDGSWTEYGNAVGVPINNPAGTVWAAK